MNLFQDTQTDVVLRASDGKIFYARKMFLSFSSSVFRDMFALPQPDTIVQHDGRPPAVELTESSSTVRHILSLCQPPSCEKQFKPNSIKELRDVLDATTKYDMDQARCVALEKLADPSILGEEPLRVYALACQHGCRKAAQLAAKQTLLLPVLVRSESYVPELEKIHAGQLCRLLLYREACISAACIVARDHTWVTWSEFSPLFGRDHKNEVGYTKVGNGESRAVHNWWLEYMRKTGDALWKSAHGNAVREQSLVDEVRGAISSSKCIQCQSHRLEAWDTFWKFVDAYAKEVDNRIAKVEINVGF